MNFFTASEVLRIQGLFTGQKINLSGMASAMKTSRIPQPTIFMTGKSWFMFQRNNGKIASKMAKIVWVNESIA